MNDSRQKIIEEMRLTLRGMLRRHTDLKNVINVLLVLLSTLETDLSTPRPIRKRTGEHITYGLEAINGRETLVEYRQGGKSLPFRVGRDVYDAVMRAVASAERPYTYEEITEHLRVTLPNKPPDFQIRTVLRFWQRGQQPILSRSRSRYFPRDAHFEKAAIARWRKLVSGRQ